MMMMMMMIGNVDERWWLWCYCCDCDDELQCHSIRKTIIMKMYEVCLFITSFYRHIDYSIWWFIVVALFAAYSYYRFLFFITHIIILIHPTTSLSTYHYFHLIVLLPLPSFPLLFLIVRSNASLCSMFVWTWGYRTGTVTEWGGP